MTSPSPSPSLSPSPSASPSLSESSSSPDPPASFSTLPPEIKSQIALVAKRQDEAYWRLEKCDMDDTDWGDHLRAAARAWEGRSLNALFLLDKCMNELAAPLLFETIWFESAKQPYFGHSICPKYHRFIKELKLCVTSTLEEPMPIESELYPLLNLAFFFPLVSLELSGDFMEILLPESEDDSASVIPSFALLSARITKLNIVDVDAVSLDELLPLFPKLSNLTFTNRTGENEPFQFHNCPNFFSILDRLSFLERLSFQSFQPADTFTPPPFTTTESTHPSLRFLSFDSVAANLDHWRFVTEFSTIDNLYFDPGEWSDEKGSNLSTDGVFPRLRSLTLRSSFQTIFDKLLPAFSKTPLTSLDLLILASDDSDEYSIDPATFNALIPTLKHLVINQYHPWVNEGFDSLSAVTKKLPEAVDLSWRRARRMFWGFCGEEDVESEDYSETEEALHEARAFLLHMVKKIESHKDFGGARHLLKQLEGLRALSRLEEL